MMEKGYIHIYTGNGKGKTTAAFGLAVRAALSGKKVFIGQFVKNMEYNETKIKDYLSNIEIKQLGRGCFIYEDPEEIDKETAKKGLEECSILLASGEYGLIILDEINIALYFKLFEVSDVVNALKNKAENTEVVLTGRYAPKELIEMADLVTKMVEIKHYYSRGVLSRNGIDH
ncbi:MAG TPA: cob(I)yrinic acid a,c-diamide adenosyltransferase [Clostridiales bacterium]|nr:cob(I)yrinic acid a,c-diamide adenosyltransferase [Clostridiales bacterium]